MGDNPLASCFPNPPTDPKQSEVLKRTNIWYVPSLKSVQRQMLINYANRQTDKHTASDDLYCHQHDVNSSCLSSRSTYPSSDWNSVMLKPGIHRVSSCSRKSSINRVFSTQSQQSTASFTGIRSTWNGWFITESKTGEVDWGGNAQFSSCNSIECKYPLILTITSTMQRFCH